MCVEAFLSTVDTQIGKVTPSVTKLGATGVVLRRPFVSYPYERRRAEQESALILSVQQKGEQEMRRYEWRDSQTFHPTILSLKKEEICLQLL